VVNQAFWASVRSEGGVYGVCCYECGAKELMLDKLTLCFRMLYIAFVRLGMILGRKENIKGFVG
jgi:hypothetical protein